MKSRKLSTSIAITTLLFSYLFSHTASAKQHITRTDIPSSKKQFIVIWDKKTSRNPIKTTSTKKVNFTKAKHFRHLTSVDIFKTPANMSWKEAMAEAKKIPGVLSVEPDYEVHAFTTPNDIDFLELWGLNNSVADIDINAPQAWDITTGSANVAIAVIDSGVNYNHADLTANMWVNPGEIPNNNIDDDGNGWVDDIHGIDTYNNDSDPIDDNGHGTHVAGTIAAVGNNAQGVTGVAWQAQIIACKFLNASGSGYSSGAIACLDYLLSLKTNYNINLIASNNSWGGGPYSQALHDAIANHRDNDILFVAASGNSASNNDLNPSYPSGFDLNNIISVAAIDRYGELASFSNYGATSVDIAAPGVDIYSTYYDGNYTTLSGTSMAAPHVAGSLVLLASQFPNKTSTDFKNLILSGSRPMQALNNTSTTSSALQLWGESSSGALNCVDQYYIERLSPLGSQTTANFGEVVSLQLNAVNCDIPSDSILVSIGGIHEIILLDDGLDGDLVEGDGILSRNITINWTGPAKVSFPDIDTDSFILTGINTPAFTDVTYDYIDIIGTPLNLSDDQSVEIPIDFDVLTPAGMLQSIWVNSNGAITDSYFSSYSNTALPAFSNRHALYPWWDDLYPGAVGNQYWQVIGAAPNRQLVVEWRDVTQCCYSNAGTDYTITFQVVLYESEEKVRFNYKDASTSSLSHFGLGQSATVGFEYNGNPSQFSYNQASLRDGLSLELTPTTTQDLSITTLSSTGLLRPDILQTITLQATSASNDPISKSIDFDDGNNFIDITTNSIQHAFAMSGNYSIIARATTEHEAVFRQLNITILPFTSDELRLIGVIQGNPDQFNLIDPVHLAAAPEFYGYISLDDVAVLDPATIDATPSGLYLWSTSQEIVDLNLYFSGIRFVWIYEEGEFKGWSPSATRRQQIIDSGYEIISSIPAGAGLWLSK